MKGLFILISISFLLFSCKKKQFDGPNSYSDGFESYSDAEQLIDGNDERWSFFQLTFDENEISLDTTIVYSGSKSIRFSATPSTEQTVSKCSINKQFMAFWEGETVTVDFWCYLADTLPADWLFIFDLEEKIPVGAGPGMRLALVDNQLLLEHKYNNPNVVQEGDGVDFPRNEWVHVKFETLLSRKKKGIVRVWQNDILVLEATNWKTLPKDFLYVQQGTKGMYNQIEFGLTANADDDAHVFYLDDVSVTTK